MTNTETLLLRRLALRDLLVECDAALERELTGTPAEQLETLRRLIEDSGGRGTPVGHAADIYRTTIEMREQRAQLLTRLSRQGANT